MVLKCGGQWSPSRVAARQASARARRADLSPDQVAELGDVTDLPTWAARARTLIERDGVSAVAIARAVGIADSTMAQRLRRYPAR